MPRAVGLAHRRGAGRHPEPEGLDRLEHLLERVGDAGAFGNLVDQPARPGGDVARRSRGLRRRGRRCAGLPDLLAQVLRREVDHERGVRAGDELRTAVGGFDRAAGRLEPEVDEVRRAQEPGVDRLRSFVRLAHAAPPPRCVRFAMIWRTFERSCSGSAASPLRLSGERLGKSQTVVDRSPNSADTGGQQAEQHLVQG